MIDNKLRRAFGTSIDTPWARRWSALHYELFDHAILRRVWTNFYEIAPGVYRSNQPPHARLERYGQMGIKTIINLRGPDKYAHYLFERESCERLGIELIDAKLWARAAATRERILRVIELFRTVERPFLFHCKSGADRAGFASAIYLMEIEGVPLEEARKQLGWRYYHLKSTKTGVLDYILDRYGAFAAHTPIRFETWVRDHYDAKTIQAEFDRRPLPPLR